MTYPRVVAAPEYLVKHPLFEPYDAREEQRNPYFNEHYDDWCAKNNQPALRATEEGQVRGSTLEFVMACRGCPDDPRPYRDNILQGLEAPFDHLNGPMELKTTLVKVGRENLRPYIIARVQYDMWKYAKGGVRTVVYWQSYFGGLHRPWLMFVLDSNGIEIVYEFPE